MAAIYRTPGVYREEIFVRANAELLTGVPVFVGFADAPSVVVETVGVEALVADLAPIVPVPLWRLEEFAAQFFAQSGSYLAAAVAGFFDNGGRFCYVMRADARAADAVTQRQDALKQAIGALEALDDIDLIAVPDAMALLDVTGKVDAVAVREVQQHLLNHCATLGNRFAILDARPGLDAAGALEQRRTLTESIGEPVNGAFYYPWLRTDDSALVPPCGQVAGIYARSDARVGVFKAPANEIVYGVVDLETAVDNGAQGDLNLQGVNCLRAFPGRGIRVWGARTLSRSPEWTYVSVRRLFLTVGRWIELNLAWAGFEPNTPFLWLRISQELDGYLTELWQAGALAGGRPEQAFHVQCDAVTNPPELRDAGQCVTELSLAPTLPAEFIRVRVVHRAGATDFVTATA